MNSFEKLYAANSIFSTIVRKRKKTVSLFLDWQNKKTYVGEGKIIEMLDFKPVVFIENPAIKEEAFLYFRPRKCLCEIIESAFYEKGFKKQFVIPFRIPQKHAEELLSKEERKYNPRNTNNERKNVLISAINFNNTLIDTIEEVEFSREVLYLYKKQNITEQKYAEIKEKLQKNIEQREKNIDERFDKLYPEKAKRLKRLKKRNND